MRNAEIAKLAQVSEATVSRVLNRRPGVSADKVLAVHQAMKTLGVRPRPRHAARARPPVDGPLCGTVAVLFVDNSYLCHPYLVLPKLRGVEQTLTAAGMNLVLAHIADPERLPPVISRGQLDGLLLWGYQSPGGVLDKLRHLPAVWLTSHSDDLGAMVMQGNQAVGRLAARYLLNQGHRQLAFLNPLGTHAGIHTRGDGFLYAAQQSGASARRISDDRPLEKPYWELSFAELDAKTAALVPQLFACESCPTGVFVPGDQMTATVYRCLEARGLQPGRDLTLISCNNEEPWLAGLRPRPATIDLGAETTGRCAAEQLLWRIRCPEEQRRIQVFVEPVLVEGEGPVREARP